MSLNLQDIPRVKTITKADFLKYYSKPQKPVVIERFIEDWPAFSKWNLEYMSQIAGDKIVPLYDDRPVDYKDGFNEPHATMKMSAYIDLLQKEPTKYRIFLYNVLKDLSKQTLLPKTVIIVEQNPNESAFSELDYLTTETWPFKIYENLPAVKANIEAGELFINDLTQPL